MILYEFTILILCSLVVQEYVGIKETTTTETESIQSWSLNTMLAWKLFCNKAYQSQYFMVILYIYKIQKNLVLFYFPDQFKKIITHYKSVGIMGQSSCLVINPITI